jgi:hypothetical protein
MNISSNEILPLPDEDELLHGKRYYKVDIENLKPQDLVIKYNRNNRDQQWIEILENPSEPGFIKWRVLPTGHNEGNVVDTNKSYNSNLFFKKNILRTIPACPPLPSDEDELLNRGLYYEVDIESLIPDEVVIRYKPNSEIPQQKIICIQILDVFSSWGELIWHKFPEEIISPSVSNIDFTIGLGIKFFRKRELSDSKKYSKEREISTGEVIKVPNFHSKSGVVNDSDDDTVNDIDDDIANKINKEKNLFQADYGGKKYKKTKRVKKTRSRKRKSHRKINGRKSSYRRRPKSKK